MKSIACLTLCFTFVLHASASIGDTVKKSSADGQEKKAEDFKRLADTWANKASEWKNKANELKSAGAKNPAGSGDSKGGAKGKGKNGRGKPFAAPGADRRRAGVQDQGKGKQKGKGKQSVSSMKKPPEAVKKAGGPMTNSFAGGARAAKPNPGMNWQKGPKNRPPKGPKAGPRPHPPKGKIPRPDDPKVLEFQEKQGKQFEMMDSNGDGNVTLEEMEAMKSKLLGRRAAGEEMQEFEKSLLKKLEKDHEKFYSNVDKNKDGTLEWLEYKYVPPTPRLGSEL